MRPIALLAFVTLLTGCGFCHPAPPPPEPAYAAPPPAPAPPLPARRGG